MTMHDLADHVGVSYSYMTQVARGRQNMGVKVQARVESALHAPAKVAPATCANRQGVVVAGESSYIRERARELGMSLRDLADRVGVSYGYISMVARGHSNMGVKVQARVASALEAPVKVAPAQPACIDREAVWDRMNAHGFSQNEVARRAGISSAHLSQIMNGKSSPSAGVLKGLHGVLFQPTKAERVMPAEVKVLGWRKGERSGIVVRGAGGPGRGAKSGGGTVRVGGRVPWGAKAEFAYRAGYDGIVGGPSHVQAFAWGRCRNPTAPAGAVQSVVSSLSALRRRLMETCVRVPASSSNYHEKEDDSNEPRRFHRHVQGRHSAKGGGVLPAALPALGERRHAPQAAPQSPWERRPTPSGARPSPSRPTGAPPSSARWARARPSVRRVTRHRIPGSAGNNSEKVLGPTDPP